MRPLVHGGCLNVWAWFTDGSAKLFTAFQTQHQFCTPKNGLGHFAESAEVKACLVSLAGTPLMNLVMVLRTLELLSMT